MKKRRKVTDIMNYVINAVYLSEGKCTKQYAVTGEYQFSCKCREFDRIFVFCSFKLRAFSFKGILAGKKIKLISILNSVFSLTFPVFFNVFFRLYEQKPTALAM